jgi:hypothetical protein
MRVNMGVTPFAFCLEGEMFPARRHGSSKNSLRGGEVGV